MDAQEDLEWEREHGEDAVFARPPFWLYLSIKSDRATLYVLSSVAYLLFYITQLFSSYGIRTISPYQTSMKLKLVWSKPTGASRSEHRIRKYAKGPAWCCVTACFLFKK